MRMLKPRCAMRGIKLYVEEELKEDVDEIEFFINDAILKVENLFNDRCSVKKIYVIKDLIESDGEYSNGYYNYIDEEIIIAYAGDPSAMFPINSFRVTVHHELIHSVIFKNEDRTIMRNRIVDEFNASYYAYELVLRELGLLEIMDLCNTMDKTYMKATEVQKLIVEGNIKTATNQLSSLIGRINGIKLIRYEMDIDYDIENKFAINILDKRFLLKDKKVIDGCDLFELEESLKQII